ncbi:unnamed protein product, partial [Ectocarpus sp. 12 AP-2014]
AALLASAAQAHLMPAGRGTLNITSDAVYMVLSLPVSTFSGADINDDGSVTMDEFNAATRASIAAIEGGIWLDDGLQRLAPQDVLLAPEAGHGHDPQALTEVSILASFRLSKAGQMPVRFGVELPAAVDSTIVIAAKNKAEGLAARLELSRQIPSADLAWH